MMLLGYPDSGEQCYKLILTGFGKTVKTDKIHHTKMRKWLNVYMMENYCSTVLKRWLPVVVRSVQEMAS